MRIILALIAISICATGGFAQELKPIQKQILDLTNALRKEEKAGPLKAGPLLTKIAQAHAQNMATQDKYGDDDMNGHILDGKGAKDRVVAAGYKYRRFGENVGYNRGYDDPGLFVFNGWKASPGHLKNMVTPEFTEIGIGAAMSQSGRWYFCQVFGLPK